MLVPDVYHKTRYEELAERIRSYAESENMNETKKALELMLHYHEGQRRKGKEALPYAVHPLTLAAHALALGLRDDTIVATCLLHDVVEDCDVTVDALGVSPEVGDAVARLSKNLSKDYADYFDRISHNRIAIVVKLLDRCNNISGMALAFSNRKMAEYIEETKKYILPLLGLAANAYPELTDALFQIEYQMVSMIETIDSFLSKQKDYNSK